MNDHSAIYDYINELLKEVRTTDSQTVTQPARAMAGPAGPRTGMQGALDGSKESTDETWQQSDVDVLLQAEESDSCDDENHSIPGETVGLPALQQLAGFDTPCRQSQQLKVVTLETAGMRFGVSVDQAVDCIPIDSSQIPQWPAETVVQSMRWQGVRLNCVHLGARVIPADRKQLRQNMAVPRQLLVLEGQTWALAVDCVIDVSLLDKTHIDWCESRCRHDVLAGVDSSTSTVILDVAAVIRPLSGL